MRAAYTCRLHTLPRGMACAARVRPVCATDCLAAAPGAAATRHFVSLCSPGVAVDARRGRELQVQTFRGPKCARE